MSFSRNQIASDSFAGILERIGFSYYVYVFVYEQDARTSIPGASLNDMAPNLSAAFCAGVISGVVSTIAQVALWGICVEISWLSMLNRDTRLTAAILMGREILQPPVAVGWQVITIATLIHFVLSIAYSFFFAFLVSRLNKKLWLAAGLIYGLAIYGVNMYGMTFIFPWFSEVRDWITVVAHAVFGICLAGAYSKLSGQKLRFSSFRSG